MTLARRVSITLLACSPALAMAHPGHDAAGTFVAGLVHPLVGVDHVAAALMAGLWAGLRHGAARALLPASFLAALLCGLLLAPWMPAGSHVVEAMIGLSLLILPLGIALSGRKALRARLCASVCMGVASFHGLAHGIEQPGGGLVAYAGGLLLATALLLAAGVVGGLAFRAVTRRAAPQNEYVRFSE